MIRKVNYLNNKDLMREIHKSKVSYCSFTEPGYSQQDIILTDVNDIKNNIETGRQCRADRLTKEIVDINAAEGIKVLPQHVAVDLATIKDTDVIFRVMTWEHIPIAEEVKKNKGSVLANELSSLLQEELTDLELLEQEDEELLIAVDKPPTKYVRTNFPPFQHFKINEEGEVICVGKSHWKGTIEGGHFSKSHGQMTNKLATMFLRLCDKYATRPNWRGYSYVDEMKCQALLQLSHVGLQFDERKSQNPFAYYTTALSNAFLKVWSLEKKNQSIRDDILEMNSMNPSNSRMNSGYDHSNDE